jgi:predicted negative regulator of RcsB-dependent stress response
VDEFMSEKEQWEAVKTWIRENGLWLLGGVGIGVAALFGWQAWQARQERIAIEASTKFEQTIEAFGRGDRTRALTLIEELQRDYGSSPYADHAQLAAARVFVESGELDKAAERLRQVMQEARDEELTRIARLRLAQVQIAQGKPDDALATLGAEAEPGAFEPRFQELRGDAHYAKGDRAAALKEYRAARSAPITGIVDKDQLDLKINDLASESTKEPAK